MKRFHTAVGITVTAMLLLVISAVVGGAAVPESQEPIPPPQQLVAPHEAIAQLGFEVLRLTEQQVLNSGQGVSLSTKLDNAADGLMVGDPDAVLRPLNAFNRELGALVFAQVIGSKDALPLLDLANQAILGVSSVNDLPRALPGITPCPTPGPCEALVLHVDQSASAGGDGSADAPFRTIAEALAAADTAQACGVEIILHPGMYRESVTLTRALRIEGTVDRPVIVGRIFNGAGHPLEVSRVALEGSPAPGAIVVDGPCGSSTEVANVVIRNANHHGIYQRRGSLRVIGTDIRGTVPAPGDADTGRAIRLLDGAQATIGLTDMSFNVGGALLASGDGTRVYLALSQVTSNTVHPQIASMFLPARAGIVTAADRALLLAEFTSIVGNSGNGIVVVDDARAHYRYGRIEHGRTVLVGGDDDSYGINALAIDGGTLQLTHFRSNHADFVGMAFLRAYGRASHGLVAYNTLGWVVLEQPPDLAAGELFACLTEEVAFLRNDRVFDGDLLPVPCDDEVPGDCPVCTVSVPFVCTWCG